MKHLILLTIFILQTCFIASAADKWQELSKLVDSEIKAITQIKDRKAKLEYRLFELYTEKMKLIREEENKLFLQATPAEVAKIGKGAYFNKTRHAYNLTKNHGLSILNKWPNNQHTADIFYTLALNSRDYGNDQFTEPFFKQTLRYAPRESKIAHNAKISLAEHFYNEKKWKNAFDLYQEILVKPLDEFHSKHLYNSAWCLYQLREFSAAIKNMHRAFAFSKNKNYININEQIFDFMGLFHVDGKDIPGGVDFYIKNTTDPGTHLIKMAKRTAKNGQFEDTRYILSKALIECQTRKQRDIEINIRLEELDVYRKFKKNDLHYQVADTLAKMQTQSPLPTEQQTLAVKEIKDYTGYLQVRLTRNAKHKIQHYNKNDLTEIISYFDILTRLDKSNIDQYRFYQGETFYAVKEYTQAANYYQMGVEWGNKNLTPENKTADNETFRRKLLDSLLATLAEGGFSPEANFKHTEFAYTNYIKSWPVDPKSQKIYERLFNLYFQKTLLDKAVDAIAIYNKNYPVDIEKHRAMLGAVIDHYVKTKNTTNLAFWVNEIISGLYSFDRTYIDKATIILGQLLFEKIQSVENKNKDTALEMYQRIYDNKIYPAKIKAEAALWISIIYLEKSNTKDSLNWALKSFDFFPDKELFENRKKYVTLANQYYLNQDFDRSIEISAKYLSRFCKDEYSEKPEFLKNIIQLQVANGKPDLASVALQEYKKCYDDRNFEIISRLSILNYYILHNDLDNFFKFYANYKKDLALTETFFSAMLKYYWHSLYLNQPSVNEKISKIFKAVLEVSSSEPAPSSYVISSIRGIFAYKDFVVFSKDFFNFNVEEKEEFDEKIFNEQLQKKVMLLKSLEDKAQDIIALGQSDVILGVYQILNVAAEDFSKILLAYNPKGMPEEFVISFKRSMNQLVMNLQTKIDNNTRSIDQLIHKNQLISYFNTEVTRDSKLRKTTGFQWPYVWRSATVDFKENDK